MSHSGVLIWAEVNEGDISGVSLELLALGRRLVEVAGGEVSSLYVAGGGQQSTAERLILHGADRVLCARGGDGEPSADDVLAALGVAAARVRPEVILLPNSERGMQLAPRLAVRLGSAAAMGCVDAAVDGQGLVFTRPCYGGKARARVRVRASPAVATLRAKSLQALPGDPARTGEVVVLEGAQSTPKQRVRVVASHRNEDHSARLDDADIVVAGGRGLGGPEGFGVLETLAEMLGGAVGASRPACDLGWYPQSRQVGLSGRTVAPELYMAVGISGAQHHMAGCGNSKVLVAVNNDPDAEIFSQAHIGVVADFSTFIPALIEVLQKGGPATKAVRPS
jgi:electron transfer flavoprotein alpha subunit